MRLLCHVCAIYLLIFSTWSRAEESKNYENKKHKYVTGLYKNSILLTSDINITNYISNKKNSPKINTGYLSNTRTFPASRTIITNTTVNISTDSIKPPATKVMEEIVKDIGILIENENPVYINDIASIVDRVNDLTNILATQNVTFDGSLLLGLENLTKIVNLNNSFKENLIRDNVALLMVDVNVQFPIAGLRIVNTGGGAFSNASFEYLYDDQNETLLLMNVSDAVIYLPDDMLSSSRIGFVIFRQDYNLGRFELPNVHPHINSPIININAGKSHYDERIKYYLKPSTQAAEYMCVSWLRSDIELEQGIWVHFFCRNVDNEAGMLHLCDCSDTSFISHYITEELETVTTTTTTINATNTASEESNETDQPTTLTTAASLTPEEQINQILDDLKNLLQDDSIPIHIYDVIEVFDQINNLLSIDEDVTIPGKILQLLEELGSRIVLNDSQNGTLVRDNIALLMANVDELNPVRGLRVASKDVEAFVDDAFEFLTDINEVHLAETKSEAVVDLPQSVLDFPRRISFVVYHDDRAFNIPGDFTVNSRVISINVENLTRFDAGEVVKIHFKNMEDPKRGMRRSCGYWAFLEDGSGYWSQEGCTFIRSNNPTILDTCQCDHLTHFAEILIPRPVFSERNEKILEILSIIGCSLSIFGILLIVLTAAAFKSWRSNFRNRIWLQLCIALFVLSVCFIVIVYMKYDEYSVSCVLTGIVLHYSLLASFFWMLMVAITAYIDTVAIKYAYARHMSHKVMIASCFSWGAPIFIISILLIASPKCYVGRFEEMTPSGSFCYPSNLALWLSVYAPIAFILIVNFVSFFYIMGAVSASTCNKKLGKQNVDDFQETVKCVRIGFVLVFLFGLPWVFGLFSFNIVAAYLFTITVTIQGFLLFLFIVCGNKDTRDFWFRTLMGKPKRKYIYRSKHHTHSTSVS
ncbi:adhesion G-protein coupled receptor G2-like isoform X2 [Galleria mellonella]|uniref:Adhesion G-protein coupled receptor G2-like isoform X2 n=1 Tax=Galleria mellonella TaxID=7137 RepID=A0ABM3N2B8_GALME|nr:adhesion G-protein coupled receptor G2-like isoform X2 [Galleria mellonella]